MKGAIRRVHGGGVPSPSETNPPKNPPPKTSIAELICPPRKPSCEGGGRCGLEYGSAGGINARRQAGR